MSNSHASSQDSQHRSNDRSRFLPRIPWSTKVLVARYPFPTSFPYQRVRGCFAFFHTGAAAGCRRHMTGRAFGSATSHFPVNRHLRLRTPNDDLVAERHTVYCAPAKLPLCSLPLLFSLSPTVHTSDNITCLRHCFTLDGQFQAPEDLPNSSILNESYSNTRPT